MTITLMYNEPYTLKEEVEIRIKDAQEALNEGDWWGAITQSSWISSRLRSSPAAHELSSRVAGRFQQQNGQLLRAAQRLCVQSGLDCIQRYLSGERHLSPVGALMEMDMYGGLNLPDDVAEFLSVYVHTNPPDVGTLETLMGKIEALIK